MPNYSEIVIPNARAASEASRQGTSAQTTLTCVAANAIITACDAAAFTATMSVAGATSANLQFLLEVLHTCGYTTSITTTTLTISWVNA